MARLDQAKLTRNALAVRSKISYARVHAIAASKCAGTLNTLEALSKALTDAGCTTTVADLLDDSLPARLDAGTADYRGRVYPADPVLA